jgi:hypothetical protein
MVLTCHLGVLLVCIGLDRLTSDTALGSKVISLWQEGRVEECLRPGLYAGAIYLRCAAAVLFHSMHAACCGFNQRRRHVHPRIPANLAGVTDVVELRWTRLRGSYRTVLHDLRMFQADRPDQ